jgi:hypothetical protein
VRTAYVPANKLEYLYESWKLLTPFVNGIKDDGSVAILASSKKTTGKSKTSSKRETDEMQVAQTYVA